MTILLLIFVLSSDRVLLSRHNATIAEMIGNKSQRSYINLPKNWV
ncbi:MAG: hypothetical protein WBA41_27210 [Rivularia sp. (in: cyanobacteria)]